MTWVIGRAGPFGYAVGLSDIKVTIVQHNRTKTEVDCLQKIYNIGPLLALGFAGSVEIGFKIIEQLAAKFNTTELNIAINPLIVDELIPKCAQEVFNSFPQETRVGGCELMLLSAHPTENDGAAPWARCYVHRFYWPNFKPVTAQPREIVSIGSGSSINPYIEALRNLETNINLFTLETGRIPGQLMHSLTALHRCYEKILLPGLATIYIYTLSMGSKINWAMP